LGSLRRPSPDATRAFYTNSLRLRLVEDGTFAILFDANGTSLRVQKVSAVSPAPYTSLGWAVEDIEKTIAQLRACGVPFREQRG
jgi:catechol 2,3-dioxygenase-like lactoylglutathione lyase family enzyme